MKTLLLALALLVSLPLHAADVWVYRPASTSHYINCTVTRDYFSGNTGQLYYFCPVGPKRSFFLARFTTREYLPPNSIVWKFYVSYMTTVLEDSNGCYVATSFRNAYGIDTKEVECQ